MVGVLSQLVPIEGVVDSKVVEGVDHQANPLELESTEQEEVASPHFPEQSSVPVKEFGPSSPHREQTISQSPEPVFQTPPPIVSSPELRARFYERFVVKASQASPKVRLSCDTDPFFNDIPIFLKTKRTSSIRSPRKWAIFLTSA